jgi:nucleoside 2-deoxyribosyltransferase
MAVLKGRPFSLGGDILAGHRDAQRIIIAGHSGLLKRAVVKRLCAEITSNEPGAKIEIIGVEDDILDLPTFLERDLADQKIEWRDSIHQRVTKWQSHQSKAKYSFLLMHLTFQWHSHLVSPLSWMISPIDASAKTALEDTLYKYAIEIFKPHRIVTLIDDIQAVQQRMGQHGYEFRLRELLRWRDTETMMADVLSKHTVDPINSRLYPFDNSPIVSIRHTPNMLYKYLCKPEIPRVYASFPVGSPRILEDQTKREEVMQEIDRFRSKLREHFTVFDPLTIDEFPLQYAFARAGSEKQLQLSAIDQWPIPPEQTLCNEPRKTIELARDDVEEVVTKLGGQEGKNEIARQTERRDFRLIDQSDFIVIYRPTYLKKMDGEWSRGTYHEALYANRVGKPFIVVRDSKNDGSLAADTLGVELTRAQLCDSFTDLQLPENQEKALDDVIQRVQHRARSAISHRQAKKKQANVKSR